MESTLGVETGSPAAVLRLLMDGAPRTRAEIVAATGLARSTVRARLDLLVAAGLVTGSGTGESTGGRPAGRFAFHPGAHLVLAAEVGATHATVAVSDLACTLLAVEQVDLDVADGPRVILPLLVATWRELLRTVPPAEVVGVGIGLPGPVEHSTGRPNNPPIMPGWDGFDVPAAIGAEFGVPVLVDNEVNLMALGEHTASHPDVSHMIVVKAATGIGAGLISNGVLHRGAAGAAGDLGHIRVPQGGEVLCRCGNTECLEAVAAGPALAARLRELGHPAHSTADVVNLVRAGNLEAGRVVRQAGRDIGEVLAGCVSMFNPSLVVIGGLLAEAGEMLLAGVRESIYRRSLPLATENLRIVASSAGETAGALGAAAMVVRHVLSPEVLDARLGEVAASAEVTAAEVRLPSHAT
ncbi:Sugar kinase of the NBD/HSP70 family, may contain an N-terminal HTH domain [Lentzea fradiae]|uniref:Sugar kinase of the NBD/HSP70 family, may contain an N-terminal HTH domain n=1 Tax=Lentzea fradiae TaxID=200378 RepID=A0A1G7KPH9_9PSEU|nr:ROK family transcriptional regulator [Lentzea fradiae]SDF39085.1 Sugar kinase of the NBD/HSP70 family, may contain an N-terminal HTH domain [Lentzea fradiae]